MRDTPLPDLTPTPADAPDVELIATSSLERTDERPHDVWVIRDNGAAEWAMAQYAQAADTVRVLTEQRDAWLLRVADWFKNAVQPAHRTVQFFDFHLQQYAVKVRVESPRTKNGEPSIKTLQLVTGKVGTRGTDEQVVVDFEADVVDWAKGQLVKLDEAGALLGGYAITLPDGTVAGRAEVGQWTDGDGVLWYLAPLSDFVVRVKESIDIAMLRRFVNVVDRDVAPDGADEPLIVRMPIGPDGDDVPGCHVQPPSVSATVTPAL